ncbi:MAG: polyprenyl diphosphate synthase [Bacteriovoracaceae bacterium]
MGPDSHKLNHVAIIMDGNGRWAGLRSHSRVWGHIRGSDIVSNIVEEADDFGLKALTLYAFSTENWSRPLTEVKVLFKLLKKFLNKERERIIKNNIKFKVIGDTSELPTKTKQLIEGLEKDTSHMDGLELSFCFGYGGRKEIIDGVNQFIKENPGKEMSEKDLQEHLYIPGMRDVDLLIRTGGDQRVSNFLLWQVAYAELYFTSTKWPDFTRGEFREILDDFGKRERRFGQIKASDSLEQSILEAKKNINQLRN